MGYKYLDKKMRKILLIILLFFPVFLSAQQDELRGTWIAWAGDNVPTKDVLQCRRG